MEKHKHSIFSKREKNVLILSLASVFAGLFIACNFALPKSVEIEFTGAHYELPLGKIQTSKYFTAEKFLANMGDEDNLGKKFVLYDYNENGNSQDMVFLMEYNLADIPIDFADQLKNINLNTELGEGLSKEFKIDKPENLEFTMGETLDLNAQILSQVTTTLAPFEVPVPGINPSTSEPVTLSTAELDAFDTVKITLDFNSPKFDYAKFRSGSLKLNLPYKESGTTQPAGWTFKARAVVKDLEGHVLVESGSDLTDVSDGTRYIELPLNGTEFYEHIEIYVHGEVSGGPDEFNPLHMDTVEFAPNITFDGAKFERLEGVTITPEQMGTAGTIEITNKTISVGATLKEQLISTTLDGGSISFQAEAPDGWSGITCDLVDFEVTGGLSLDGDDFDDADEVPEKNFLINKTCDLDGKTLTGDDIVINGKVMIGVTEGTLVFESDDPVSANISGVVEIDKIGETIVDISKIIDPDQLQKSVTQSLGSEVQEYLKRIDFSSLSFTCDFTGSELPANNIMLNATVNSTAFGVSGMPAEDPVNLADGNKLVLKKEFNPAHSYVPTTPIDAEVSVSLSRRKVSEDDTANPTYVTFEEFELGKDYKMNLNIDFDFTFYEICLNAAQMGLSDKTIETGLNVNELFKSTLGDTLPTTELDKIGFSDDTVAYLYVSKPEIEGSDPLAGLEISAKIKAMDGAADIANLISDEADHSLPKELNFVSSVLNLSDFATVKEEDGKIYRCVTKQKDKLFPIGSYTEKINFAEILNAKPENLAINYDLAIGNGGSGEITITGDQFEAMKTAADNDEFTTTSIQIKMVVYLPLALEVTPGADGKGFEISNMLGLGESIFEGDLLRRENADDFDEVKKYIDIVEEMGVTYKANYDMGVVMKMIFQCGDDPENVITKKIALDKPSSEGNFGLNKSDIDKIFDNYPVTSSISISVGDVVPEAGGTLPSPLPTTTFKIPRSLDITLFADLKIKDGERITIWEE